jgi:hypothetical protein
MFLLLNPISLTITCAALIVSLLSIDTSFGFAPQHIHVRQFRRLHSIIGGGDDDASFVDEEADNISISDSQLYRDFRKAKQSKLGGEIPSEQAKQSAEASEKEFLDAMRETKQEFQAAKERLGSDGAVDLFLGMIREEDERKQTNEDGEDDILGEFQ